MKTNGFNAVNASFKRQCMSVFSPFRVGIILSLALLMGPVSPCAAKPVAKVPKLDSTLCPQLGGTWEVNTCTIAGGNWGQATSSFLIPGNVSLVIQGDGAPTESPPENPTIPCTFVLGFGATLQNDGLIRIETTGDWGFCNLGTLDNAGSLEVGNIWVEDPNVIGGNIGIFNAARITNSGTITVRNLGGFNSTGIWNLPHIPEDASPWAFDTILPTISNSGTILIENNGDGSSGIDNEGAFSNAGTITVSAGIVGLYGFSNMGAFTNEASGILVNYYGDPSLVPPVYEAPTYGVANFDGTMINYGSVTNEAVIGTNGWAMLTYGTLDNRGVLFQSDGVLVNYGTVHNWGAILTDGSPDYPHNEGVCENLPNEDGSTGTGC